LLESSALPSDAMPYSAKTYNNNNIIIVTYFCHGKIHKKTIFKKGDNFSEKNYKS